MEMLASEDVQVRPMFRDLCRSLSREERQQLLDNIEAHGIQDPVKLWGDVVVDGHNRVEIAEELGVSFPVVELHFESDADAKEWIIKNQLGRRNLDPQQRQLLIGRLYNDRKQAAHRPAKKGGQSDHLNSPEGKTAEVIANEVGVSEKTVRRSGDYVEAVDSLAEKAQQAVSRGDVKLTRDDVERLSEQPAAVQEDIVEAAMMGDVDIKSALAEAEAETVVELSVAQQAVELAPEFLAQQRNIGKVLAWVKQQADGPAGRFLTEHLRQLEADLKNAQAAIKTGTPYAVCCYCNGRIDHEMRACDACRGWGWLTRQAWDNTPEELRG